MASKTERSYADTLDAFLNPKGGSAVGVDGGAASAPTLLSNANPYIKYGASAASIGGDVLSSFLQMKQAEEQARLAKESLKLQKRAQAFSEKQYNDGSTQRGVNLTGSAYTVAGTAQDWRDRIREIVRGR